MKNREAIVTTILALIALFMILYAGCMGTRMFNNDMNKIHAENRAEILGCQDIKFLIKGECHHQPYVYSCKDKFIISPYSPTEVKEIQEQHQTHAGTRTP